MLLEHFLANDAHRSNLNQALSLLHQANFFGVMLEVAATRTDAQPSTLPIETAALRASWHNGYVEALRDLYHFQERYVNKNKPVTPMNFSAPQGLFMQGEIDEDEYYKLTGHYPDPELKPKHTKPNT